MGVLCFDGMSVDGDCGGIGEQEFYAGGVHVEMAMDGVDGVIHGGFSFRCRLMVD